MLQDIALCKKACCILELDFLQFLCLQLHLAAWMLSINTSRTKSSEVAKSAIKCR